MKGNDQTTTVTPDQAIAALHARGVDQTGPLLEQATPDQILLACHRWDARTGVGPGLLVNWIRTGQFLEPEPEAPPTPSQQLRAKFDRYAQRYPIGFVVEPHRVLDARRWPEWGNDPPCPGHMTVTATKYPVLALQCDKCGFENVGQPHYTCSYSTNGPAHEHSWQGLARPG